MTDSKTDAGGVSLLAKDMIILLDYAVGCLEETMTGRTSKIQIAVSNINLVKNSLRTPVRCDGDRRPDETGDEYEARVGLLTYPPARSDAGSAKPVLTDDVLNEALSEYWDLSPRGSWTDAQRVGMRKAILTAIASPPPSGIWEALVEQCAKIAEKKAGYVSCDPTFTRGYNAGRDGAAKEIRAALSQLPATDEAGTEPRPAFCATADSICHHPACTCMDLSPTPAVKP